MELEYINTSATLVIFKMVQSINGYICQAKQCNKYTCHIYNKLLDFTLDCAKESFNSNRVVRTKWRMSKVRINDVFGGKVSNLSVMAD